MKLALVAPAATVIEAGTVTASPLLDRLTANPPLGAAVFSVIVQRSVPAPVIDERLQPRPLNAGALGSFRLAAFSCNENVSTALPALAVSVTVCAVLTAEMLALKSADVDPAATVIDAGTVTAPLVLPRLTANPPLGAAAFSVIVQRSVPAPVIDDLKQLSPLNVAALGPSRLAALSCTAKSSTTPPALAVSVTA
jgi:hypothetical protein